MTKAISIVPIWESALPFILENLRSSDAYIYRPARVELSLMAEAAGQDIAGLDQDYRSRDPKRRAAAQKALEHMALAADAHNAKVRP